MLHNANLGWFSGELNGKRGLFPGNYCRFEEDPPIQNASDSSVGSFQSQKHLENHPANNLGNGLYNQNNLDGVSLKSKRVNPNTNPVGNNVGLYAMTPSHFKFNTIEA